MQDKIMLYVRNRWQQEEFRPYDERQTMNLYEMDFYLQFSNCRPHKLKLNDALFHTFDEKEDIYYFTLTTSKAATLVVEYEEDGTLYHWQCSLNIARGLQPTAYCLEQIQQQYLTWKNSFLDTATILQVDKVELADFYDNRSWEGMFQKLQESFENPENTDMWFYHYRQEITRHLQRILRNPKKRLDTEEMLVSAAEIDKITPRTMQHFMQDTTTWAKSTVNRPVPQRLMKEFNEESIDVLENRFVLTFAYCLERKIRKTLKQLQDDLHTIELNLLNSHTQLELDILRAMAEEETYRLTNYKEFFTQVELQLRTLYKLTRQTIRQFSQLRILHGYIQPNQVLLYNKDYKILYKLYNQHLLQQEKVQRLHDCIDYQTYYTDQVFLHMLHFLQSMKFVETTPIVFNMSANLEDYIFTREDMTFSLQKDTILIDITRRHRSCEIDLQMTRLDTEQQQQVRFIPTVVQFSEATTMSQIDQLYTHQEQVDTFIVYPTNSQADYERHMPYEQLHKVFTLGTNFIDSTMFQKYGAMKYGVFPFTQNDLSKRVFERFIRLQLFKLGIRSHCFMCGSRGQLQRKKGDEEEYICENYDCRCEWGMRRCSCGSPIYKMQKAMKKERWLSPEEEESARSKSDVDWLFEQESKQARMALANLCENAHRGNSFFAVCPNCGDCQDESSQGRICKRCDAKNRCLTMK